MAEWRRGDFVELDGLLAVVVGIEGDPGIPEEHVGLWFGDPNGRRKSQGGTGGRHPEIWTVPEDYCVPAEEAIYKH